MKGMNSIEEFRKQLELIHLQWHAKVQAAKVEEDEDEDEEETAEEEEDTTTDDSDRPGEDEHELDEDDAGVEFVEDDDLTNEEPDEETTQLNDTLARLAGKIGEGNKQDQTAEILREGFANLEKIVARRDTSPQGQQVAGEKVESLEDFQKRISEKYFDDPVKAAQEIADYQIRAQMLPVLQQIVGGFTKVSASTSKANAKNDPVYATVMEKWGDDVEEQVAQLTKNNPLASDTYEQACAKVAQSHFSELVQLEVEKAVKKAGKPATPAKGGQPKGAAGRGTPKGGTSTEKVSKSSPQYRQVAKFAIDKGVTEKEAYRFLKENNMLVKK